MKNMQSFLETFLKKDERCQFARMDSL